VGWLQRLLRAVPGASALIALPKFDAAGRRST
jgi:hypothetical protein